LLDIEAMDDGSVAVRGNILLLQGRWNLNQQFSGDRRDVLVPHGDGFRIRSRLIVMDRQVFTHQGLSVFF
jgi:3-phenylpropionate/cinnamic acid dioxygenase small subunit